MADTDKRRITDVDFIESLNSDESFFINQNNTIKQINRGKVVFGITNGGTGATTVADARNNLGLGNTAGALPVANGGTGASDAAAARANIGAVAMTSKTVKLAPSSWSSLTQTVSVSGVTASNTVVVAPAPESYAAYGEAGVYCSAQASGKLTFKCETVPSATITVNVLILA